MRIFRGGETATGRGGGKGEEVAFNSLFMGSLCLRLIQIEPSARDEQVWSVFVTDINISLLIRSQEETQTEGLWVKAEFLYVYWTLD